MFGAYIGRNASEFPKLLDAWKHRAKDYVAPAHLDTARRITLRRDKVADPNHALGKYATGLDDGSLVADRAIKLRNYEEVGKGKHCLEFFDKTTGVCVFGFVRDGATGPTRNRWKSIALTFLANRQKMKRGKSRLDEPEGSKMVAVGYSAGATADLRRFVTTPSVRRAPDGVAARMEVEYRDAFVWEFLRACGNIARDEITNAYTEHREKYGEKMPPTLWVTENYMVRP